MASAPAEVSYAQVIEYIPDRLYLAYYSQPPTDQTPFPWPLPSPEPPKRMQLNQGQGQADATQTPTVAPVDNLGPGGEPPVYFTVDDDLLYNAFHHDFGPLHVGHVYHFAALLHEMLSNEATSHRAVVLWSKPDPKHRTNAACLLATYMVVIQDWPPHLALAPIAQANPPFMPFRDAGYSQADYNIVIQDVVYGVWKAIRSKILSLEGFNIDEYELHERVEYGDFNWVTPDFLAFASPQHKPVAVIHPSDPKFATIPTTVNAVIEHPKLPNSFKWVLAHFVDKKVGLVVRLNSELYSPSYFTALGINHIDMIFPDGTCPVHPLVRRFVNLAHRTIASGKSVAVHCKAGLGRTGCLIGAYLIYRYGFTANEVIAFMRFMRPGMVVGPQQHWLHMNQGRFREWWVEDSIKAEMAAAPAIGPKTPIKRAQHQHARSIANSTPPPQGVTGSMQPYRSVFGPLDGNGSPHSSFQDDLLPAPTPGQPRKVYRKASPSAQPTSAGYIHEDADVENTVKQEKSQSATEIGGATYYRSGTTVSNPAAQADDEWSLQMLAKRRTSRSPANQDSRRVATYTNTLTSTSKSWMTSGNDSDLENQIMSETMAESRNEARTMSSTQSTTGEVRKGISPRQSSRSGSGAGTLAEMSKVRRESPRNKALGASPEGVRKSSRTANVENLMQGLRRIS